MTIDGGSIERPLAPQWRVAEPAVAGTTVSPRRLGSQHGG